ncbi:MAG TPA: serine acetyltransferase [Cellvibrionaceae bacterium]|nr:serine acetyltransferase [Cellvibrionaceae bacterium]
MDQIVQELREARSQWRNLAGRSQELGQRDLPSRQALEIIFEQLCGALFPLRLGPPDLRAKTEDFYVGHTLDLALNELWQQVLLELRFYHRNSTQHRNTDQIALNAELKQNASNIVHQFAQKLPEIRRLLDRDVQAAFNGDPAARSFDEVLLCYPGITAIIHHRLAHELYRLDLPLLARILAELAHSRTGIDIHPGAQIGPGFFIDHGTGVVIGETAIIGARVRLYQAVTLGAKRFPVDAQGSLEKGLPRHPIVEDDVVIYAGATILGRITIGKGSVIGGNVWLTRNVAAGSQVTQANSQQLLCESTDEPI